MTDVDPLKVDAAGGEVTDAQAAVIERTVIASVLADRAALSWIGDELVAADFADPRLGRIFDGFYEMLRDREPISPITVMDHLAGWGVRGITLGDLHSWAAEALPHETGWFARKVHDLAMRRELRAEASRMAQAAGGSDPAGEIVAGVIDRLRELQTRGVREEVTARTLGAVLEQDTSYDWAVEGLIERGDRLILTGSEGGGKALALDTPIPTPTGWTTMGEIAVGEFVLGADGRPARVLFATEAMHDHECLRVEFSDGASIVADADHLWLTEDYRARNQRPLRTAPLRPRGTDQRVRRTNYGPAVRTTREIAETLWARGGHTLNHSIPVAAPLDLPAQSLSVSPWVLGAWLGDGTTAAAQMTIGDQDANAMIALFAAEGLPLAASRSAALRYSAPGSGWQTALRMLGVLGAKHIPAAYLRGSFDQRLALLQGLMDTDGTVLNKAGSTPCEISLSNDRLAADVLELILSLGIKATSRRSVSTLNGRAVGTRNRILFQTDLPVFRLPRKAAALAPATTERSRRRYITAVVPVESVPVRCIQVENADRLYLAGREMIPTHNTTLLRQIAVMAAAGLHPFSGDEFEPVRVLYVDTENTEKQWARETAGLAKNAAHYGRTDPRETLRLHVTKRMNLTSDRDLGMLHRLVDLYDPAVLMIGPLYRLVPFAINDDDEATPLLTALDTIRDRGVALCIEAHAGHGRNGQNERDLRPRGSSALMGWPEFGLGLRVDKGAKSSDVFELSQWRGHRDAGRKWPLRVQRRAGVWPWMTA